MTGWPESPSPGILDAHVWVVAPDNSANATILLLYRGTLSTSQLRVGDFPAPGGPWLALPSSAACIQALPDREDHSEFMAVADAFLPMVITSVR